MDVRGAVVVVTGGASGIGAAMCRRFGAEGAALVVVADLDGADAAEVADQARAAGAADAVPVAGDVSDPDHVAALVDRAGGAAAVDLFCANAGIATAAGLEAPPEVWARTWDVNVMAHVHAARTLVPAWLERGGGHLLVTASAAGLLSNLGDAPYSVTKHAAVAFAEWLSITYGDRGIRVSCLCPQGVRTPMLFPDGDDDGGLAGDVVRAQGVIEPEEVADAVVAGLADERFLILPHPEAADHERSRAGDRERWLRGMRRLQARLGG